MTFKDVVFKNFKWNIKKYFAYFLSSCFSIFLFFIYATIIFNQDINHRNDTEVLSYVFPITMVAIALFSIFFINYAHSAFIKGRNKEFGVYISLGMDIKELKKMIHIENIVIYMASLIFGIGAGALFSRLFQMIIMKMLEIKNIRYYLDYKSFIVTFLVFLIIFMVVMTATGFRMSRLDINSLLQEARNSEGKEYDFKDLVFGTLGLFIMAGSVVFLGIIAKKDSLNSNPLILMIYMLTAFLGVYMALSHGGNLILHLIKGSSYYHKNMLFLTQLHYKFNQNKKIIFILSVLSTMTIFLVASPFSLLRLTETLAEMDKNHLEYVETDTMNKLSEEELHKIINKEKVTGDVTLKFIYLSTKRGSNSLKDSKPVISADEYNALTGGSIKLAKGEAYNIIIDWRPGYHGVKPGSMHELEVGGKAYPLRFIASQRGEWVAGTKSFPTDSVVVISKEDYSNISASITKKNIGYYHLIHFKNWKKSRTIVEELRKKLGAGELKVISIIDSYEDLKKGYSVFLFVCTVMGILFFAAGGSVLYFKQYTELPDSKAAFHKLYKIGITDKEMKKIIGKELMVVFFLPLIFGTFLGVSLMYLMTYIVGGEAVINEFMKNAFIVVVIYFLSQGIFYAITKNKYNEEIVRG